MEGGTIYHQIWDNIKKKVKADRPRRGGGLVITVSHNVPNNIAGTYELRKLTDVGESFCELNFVSWVISVQGIVWFDPTVYFLFSWEACYMTRSYDL